jgi:Zn finger protein HypA/HybF involved in hydrogenase expression
MGDVIDLDTRRKLEPVEVQCMACYFRWTATPLLPSDVSRMECAKCGEKRVRKVEA